MADTVKKYFCITFRCNKDWKDEKKCKWKSGKSALAFMLWKQVVKNSSETDFSLKVLRGVYSGELKPEQIQSIKTDFSPSTMSHKSVHYWYGYACTIKRLHLKFCTYEGKLSK